VLIRQLRSTENTDRQTKGDKKIFRLCQVSVSETPRKENTRSVTNRESERVQNYRQRSRDQWRKSSPNLHQGQ
tara:strand:+ start:665 stop:883 length:219 start_codon:yes stop_codon:yes gene_type:complete